MNKYLLVLVLILAVGAYQPSRTGVQSFNTVSSDRGNNSFTLTAGTDVPVQLISSSIAGANTITLSTSGAVNGDTFTIVRTGLGVGTVDVGGLKTLPTLAASSIRVTYTGSAWILISYSLL